MRLTQERCFHHAMREAAVRCPSCSRFYCRECVAEHEGKYLCTSCLASQVEMEEKNPVQWSMLYSVLKLGFAVVLLFAVFSLLGNGLATIPEQFFDEYEAPAVYELDGGGP